MKNEIFRFVNLSSASKIPQNCLNMELCEGEIVGISGLDDSSYTYALEVLWDRSKLREGRLVGVLSSDDIGRIQHADYEGVYGSLTVAENICDVCGKRALLDRADSQASRAWVRHMAEQLCIELEPQMLGSGLDDFSKLMVLLLKQIYLGKRVLILDRLMNILPNRLDTLDVVLRRIVQKYSCGVIMVSNELEPLKLSCDRIYIIRNGYTTYCMQKDSYQSDHRLHYEHLDQKWFRDLVEKFSADPTELLLRLRGDDASGGTFQIPIYRSQITGFLDVGGRSALRLREIIQRDRGSTGPNYVCDNLSGRKRLRVAYYNDLAHSYYFPSMSLRDNLCIHAVKNTGIFGNLFLSRRKAQILLQEFLSELDELGIPVKRTQNLRYVDLDVEQKTCAAFFKLRLIRPDVLIIEDKPVIANQLILKLITKFLPLGTAIIVMDCDQRNLIPYCSSTYVFSDGVFHGVLEEGVQISEDYFLK